MRACTRAKILATIGPASLSAACIEAMLHAGADTFRINMSHGTKADHSEAIRLIRAAERAIGKPVGIMADLPGPKLRLSGTLPASIETGTTVEFSDSEVTLGVDQPAALHAVAIGDRVLLDDGAIRLLVVDRTPSGIACQVLKGGLLRPRIGVNLPDSDVALPAVGERDLDLARFALDEGVDLLAVSFCRDGEDIRSLRAALDSDIQFVAKIERPAAVAAIDDILEAAEFMLVARGDLGVEMDVAQVPVIQKQLIDRARFHGCPTIVATQMLHTMIEMHAPTRAEASDVANAILDGADAIMLSGETAIGHDPALVVETMDRIAHTTEAYARSLPPRMVELSQLVARTFSAAQEHGADLVVVSSRTDSWVRRLSRAPLSIPILALSEDLGAARRMQLLRGVEAEVIATTNDQPAFDEFLPAIIRRRFGVEPGTSLRVVVLAPDMLTDDVEVREVQL